MRLPTLPRRGGHRLSIYSLVWIIAALILIPYEIAMILRNEEGGPLTHVVKWAYGDRGSATWWLVGWPTSGFILWCIPHFLFDWGAPALIALVALGLLVGIVGITFF